MVVDVLSGEVRYNVLLDHEAMEELRVLLVSKGNVAGWLRANGSGSVKPEVPAGWQLHKVVLVRSGKQCAVFKDDSSDSVDGLLIDLLDGETYTAEFCFDKVE